MNGGQSFLRNDVKRVIRHGGNVTHILNVKVSIFETKVKSFKANTLNQVSNQPNDEVGQAIRRRIFQHIQGRPQLQEIDTVPVTITWHSSAHSTSAYYYADVPMFTDVVVKRHTSILLQNLLQQIDGEFGAIFARGTTRLAFLVTKPLTREVVLDYDSDVDLAQGDEEGGGRTG